jgi:protein tyrosine phosphatase
MHKAIPSSHAAAKLPAWLPQPLRSSYIRSVAAELTSREALRSQLSDPAEDIAKAYPTLASTYSTSIGHLPLNARLNRYVDVVPYDATRVKLQDEGYVNASWVRQLNGGKWTIATQAPLEKTAHSFLSLFLQPLYPPREPPPSTSPPPTNRLRTIVQLTPNVEGRFAKATPYFPKTVGEEMIWPAPRSLIGEGKVPAIKVKLLQIVTEGETWIHSVLELSYQDGTSPPHLVRHLHFLVNRSSFNFQT